MLNFNPPKFKLIPIQP